MQRRFQCESPEERNTSRERDGVEPQCHGGDNRNELRRHSKWVVGEGRHSKCMGSRRGKTFQVGSRRGKIFQVGNWRGKTLKVGSRRSKTFQVGNRRGRASQSRSTTLNQDSFNTRNKKA